MESYFRSKIQKFKFLSSLVKLKEKLRFNDGECCIGIYLEYGVLSLRFMNCVLQMQSKNTYQSSFNNEITNYNTNILISNLFEMKSFFLSI